MPQITSIPSSKRNKNNITCAKCLMRSLCLAHKSIKDNAIAELESVIEKRRTIYKGDIIYKAGDEFRHLYAIRTGSVKIYSINEQGDEQITGFHMPGDLIGFDAIAENEHQSFAESLETTSICEISFSNIMELVTTYPNLNLRLFKLISQEISTKKNLMMVISKQTAEQRLASFILHMSYSLYQRKMSKMEIKLSMTRYEIGNYISLTVETISRLLTKFQERGIIKVHGRFISITDLDALKSVLSS